MALVGAPDFCKQAGDAASRSRSSREGARNNKARRRVGVAGDAEPTAGDAAARERSGRGGPMGGSRRSETGRWRPEAKETGPDARNSASGLSQMRPPHSNPVMPQLLAVLFPPRRTGWPLVPRLG